ncbi:MAG: branched-chain amino acid ABC transporter permease [Deltaproteobacteria bacterium CG_4_8_14_3_um_filter_51_11]|nr:branched-chain amino acid ABC transporter permease [bacterium]OIP37197.1 MAG: branched-chain amino acid ABC transporter permease [Desulfobacteraceae bacterium CG2_30_51_40]PIW01417.1 MAG: branched-chain amino acid ABC transporter permease [Deltaproteobacteria bacterium CG17_big_fil_post_rev_8_21_14_2_50_51_6]PIX20777.1 MAG: branched-chain amino acid ABC transporter permease [Deltaproteobacteria bacterium CG_4_8_14_3_um_filter_51_11]PJB37595.1 MAG: branched-chain amino acid ABC transporter pe
MKKRKERIDRGIKVRSEDIFALTSYREMIYLLAPRALPVVGLLLFVPLFSPYWREIFISTAIYALLAISWDVLVSVGLISLGQSFFYGVGSYVAGALNHYWGLPPVLTLPVATIGGAAICTIALLPVLRLRGIYFSMVTLVLPLMILRLVEATRIFGGTEGLTGLSPFPGQLTEMYIANACLLIALFGFRRLLDSDYGLIVRGINDNDRAVMNAGLNIHWYKTQILFLGAAVGCFAGAFGTHHDMFAGMPGFALDYSIMPIAAAIVGGTGTFAGSVLGAFILVPLSEILRALGALRIVFYGLFLVIFVVGIPEGLFHYIRRKYHQFERWVDVE